MVDAVVVVETRGRDEGDDEARKIKSIGSRLINPWSVRLSSVTVAAAWIGASFL